MLVQQGLASHLSFQGSSYTAVTLNYLPVKARFLSYILKD